MALEFRDGKDLVIQADLPGIDPERDVEVWISHDVLHIRAGSRRAGDEADRHSDLRFGTFVRDIALPPGTEEATVRAVYVDGCLEVRAPLGGRGTPKSRRVPVVRDWSPSAHIRRQRPTLRTPRRSGRRAS